MANRGKTVQRDPFGRVQSEYEEENEEESTYDINYGSSILRDGERLRVPLYMRDGSINPDLTPTQRGKAAQQAQAQVQAQDAAARRFGLQLHKPGFRYNMDSAASERIRQAYADADAADANAWKNSSAPGKTSATTPASRTGDLRTAPNNQRRDAPAMDAKAQAYAAYDEEMQNAWRGSK